MLLLLLVLLFACEPKLADNKRPSGPSADEPTNQAQAGYPKLPQTKNSRLALDSLAPNRAPLLGDVVVKLHGNGFRDPLQVSFGGAEPVPAQVISETEAMVVAPAAGAAGTVDVTVTAEDGAEATKRAAFIYGGTAPLGVQYCLLRMAASVSTSSPSATALVYAAGHTSGAGQGAGVVGQLGYGSAGSVPSMYEFINMSYSADEDGLTPGDQANDVYAGTLSISTPGEYKMVARFRLESEPDGWLYCDLDGTPFDLAQQATVHAGDGALPSTCQLRFPVIAYALPGANVRFYAASADATSGEFLVGPIGGELSAVTATLTDGEWWADLSLADAGDARVAFRASIDGTHWRQCDFNGGSEFYPLATAALSVRAAGKRIDYCRIWQRTLAGAAPLVTVEVYEAGITDAGAANDNFVVEAGYGGVGANPFFADGYIWSALGFKTDGGSNDEYEGSLSVASGTYGVVARVRRAGETDWTFCDRDETSMDFRINEVTPLTVP